MAWVKQTIESQTLSVDLLAGSVCLRGETLPGILPGALTIEPRTRQEAHDTALVLRRAARRLEEIGKGLEQ